MLGVDQLVVQPPAATEKKHTLSTATKRTGEWIFSQEIPSDITVNAGELTFSLHKFPLVSKCGYIRKLVAAAEDGEIPVINLLDVPGGAEVFELAAKFCYGINLELSPENIAVVRCVAEYLEMTEDYAVKNLVTRAEAYLEEVALISLSSAVTILRKSEDLKPISEEVKLISRCIDTIAYIACNDNQFWLSTGTDNTHDSSSSLQSKAIVDWYVEELTVLKIETFQRVVMAMKARGFKEYALGPVVMLYAQKSLRGLDIFGRGRKKTELRKEHEKRVVLETIVGVLPNEKNAMSVSFISMLLRAAIYLETTVACRLDLEKRMSLQLGHAVLEDLLIPSLYSGDTMFDVDTVQRILMNYLDSEVAGSQLDYMADDDCISPPRSDIEQVGKLMECYLAEVASDPNLSISRFIGLAELVPEQVRVTEDGMYRAIDIYLKAHPNLGDPERKKCAA